MKAYAVGWVRIGDKNFPEPTGVNSTWAVFASRINAEKFAKKHGGCEIRPCEMSLKFGKATGVSAIAKKYRNVPS